MPGPLVSDRERKEGDARRGCLRPSEAGPVAEVGQERELGRAEETREAGRLGLRERNEAKLGQRKKNKAVEAGCLGQKQGRERKSFSNFQTTFECKFKSS